MSGGICRKKKVSGGKTKNRSWKTGFGSELGAPGTQDRRPSGNSSEAYGRAQERAVREAESQARPCRGMLGSRKRLAGEQAGDRQFNGKEPGLGERPTGKLAGRRPADRNRGQHNRAHEIEDRKRRNTKKNRARDLVSRLVLWRGKIQHRTAAAAPQTEKSQARAVTETRGQKPEREPSAAQADETRRKIERETWEAATGKSRRRKPNQKSARESRDRPNAGLKSEAGYESSGAGENRIWETGNEKPGKNTSDLQKAQPKNKHHISDSKTNFFHYNPNKISLRKHGLLSALYYLIIEN
jgi:hypothetical protein